MVEQNQLQYSLSLLSLSSVSGVKGKGEIIGRKSLKRLDFRFCNSKKTKGQRGKGRSRGGS